MEEGEGGSPEKTSFLHRNYRVPPEEVVRTFESADLTSEEDSPVEQMSSAPVFFMISFKLESIEK